MDTKSTLPIIANSAVGQATRKPIIAAPRNVKNPKVFLVRPPQQFFFGVWPRGPRLGIPTGLLSIASFLEAQNIDVELYDCFVEGSIFSGDSQSKKKLLSSGGILKKWMHMYEDGGVTPDEAKASSGLRHFGASWDDLKEALREHKPDIVGISNIFRENTNETIQAAQAIRSVLPNALVVCGGPNATALPDFLLEEASGIDIIGLGDGEDTMLELTEWMQGKREIDQVSSIVYRSSQGHIKTTSRNLRTDLDKLGHLNYNLLKLERYFTYERSGIMARNKFSYGGAERSVSLVTSRGCPYQCSFCSIHIHAGRKYRRYSVDHILDHLETLVRVHGVRHIHFEDDNLTLDKPRFMRLMKGVLARKFKFTWDTPNGVFANTLDEEMLRLMKKTGCTYLVVGVESGDQWVLDNVIKKQPLTIEKVIDAFELGKKVGIDMQAFYIIGFPRETREHIDTTLKFAMEGLKKYNVLPHMAIARADPGTDLFAEAKENDNLVTDFSISNVSGVHADMFVRHMIKNDHFTPDELMEISEDFHKRAIQQTALSTFGYLLAHPKVALRNGLYFLKLLKENWSISTIKDNIVRLFFCRLFYRNSMLRQDYFESDEFDHQLADSDLQRSPVSTPAQGQAA